MRLSPWARWIALLSHLVLIAAQWAALGTTFGVLLLLPLLPVVIGLWQKKTYTAAWGSMLVLLYFTGWATEAFGGGATFWIWVACSACVMAFVSDLLYVKWFAVEARVIRAAQTGL